MGAIVLQTPIGELGLVFSERGLRRLQLPIDPKKAGGMRGLLTREGHALDANENRIASSWSARLLAHLGGEDVEFDDLPIDYEGVTPFRREVYRAARAIPRGETITYAELAKRIGTKSSRAVGVALGKNPIAIVVPCHRIVGAADCGGFSAHGGTSTKATLLAIEGGALGDPEHRLARRHLAKIDPELTKIVRRLPCTLPVKPKGALFRTLVRAIAGQQLSTKAAATIFGRLEQAVAGATGVSSWVAPAQDDPNWPWKQGVASRILAMTGDELRALGLSHAKARALHDLAQKVDDRTLDLDRLMRAPDDVVVSELVKVRGIGRWTVEMLLIFDFGRPDVLPVDDLGIRKGFQKLFRLRALPEAEAITRRAERWRPWRSIGSWYLWRALDPPTS